MNYTEFLEIYGENAPILLNNLNVLHAQYGENTAVLVQKTTDLHIKAGNALLFPNPEMSYPEFSDNSFRSKSGVKYILHGSLNQKRFEQLEKLMLLVDLGETMSNPSTFINQMKSAINAKDLAFAGNLLYQFEAGLGYNQRMSELIMLACTLFIVRENNNKDWNEADAIETIKDWQSIPYAFFLVSYIVFKQIFTETCKAGFQNTLRTQVQIEKPTQSKVISFFKQLKKLKTLRVCRNL